MDVLVPPWVLHGWEVLNKVLGYPVITLLTSILLGSPFFFRRVRKAGVRYSVVVFGWIVERLTALMKTTYKVLGVARQQDIDELRTELRQAIKSTSVQTNEAVPTRTISRAGTKVRLSEEIWRYLGKEDPRRVDSRTLDRVLQGPFCEECSYSLPEYSQVTGHYNVMFRCPYCSHTSSKNEGSMNLDEFKQSVYRGLDAEFQRTGTIKDTL
jgi:hypothetical protein